MVPSAEELRRRWVLNRRALLSLTCAFAISGIARAQEPASQGGGANSFAGFEALLPYCGVYRFGVGRTIGVDRFVNDSGNGVLLWADHTNGVVRQMFESSADAFSVGTDFSQREPIELEVRFTRSLAGEVCGLRVQNRAGQQTHATKAATREEEVAFANGDASLDGTLILPDGPGPHPAIVLLHGSGPLTRYSFGPYPRFFNSLGLAVLHFDKRGAGRSSGWRVDASTGAPDRLMPSFYPEDLLGDALAAFDLLRSRPEIDASRIGFWGSSEGGMLATQAAARNPAVAFAINSCGFMGPLWKTLLYQADVDLRVAGATELEIAEAVAFNKFALDVAGTGERYDEFLRLRQELLDSGRKTWIAWYIGDYNSLEQMRWSWDHILSFDPTPALPDVRCPALGIFGEFDRATESAQAAPAMRDGVLAGGNPDVTVRIIPNGSHSLTEQLGLRAPRGNRMAPGTFELLHEWLTTRVVNRTTRAQTRGHRT
jgi:pimeloyl-ACP methyl ester carboxylesterase